MLGIGCSFDDSLRNAEIKFHELLILICNATNKKQQFSKISRCYQTIPTLKQPTQDVGYCK